MSEINEKSVKFADEEINSSLSFEKASNSTGMMLPKITENSRIGTVANSSNGRIPLTKHYSMNSLHRKSHLKSPIETASFISGDSKKQITSKNDCPISKLIKTPSYVEDESSQSNVAKRKGSDISIYFLKKINSNRNLLAKNSDKIATNNTLSHSNSLSCLNEIQINSHNDKQSTMDPFISKYLAHKKSKVTLNQKNLALGNSSLPPPHRSISTFDYSSDFNSRIKQPEITADDLDENRNKTFEEKSIIPPSMNPEIAYRILDWLKGIEDAEIPQFSVIKEDKPLQTDNCIRIVHHDKNKHRH